MKRTHIVLLAGIVVAGLASAPASARRAQPTVQLRQTKLGKILVTSRGFTIYAFTRDGRNVDRCAQINGCLRAWPLVTASGKPAGGAGIRSSLLGTIKLKGGAHQVTYAGHPLYTYAGDSRPGQTEYVNFSQFGGNWPAVNASGAEVK